MLWILLGIGAAAFAGVMLYNWVINASQRGDFIVLEIAPYSDGAVFVTIKNTGTIPITAVRVNGQSASGSLPLGAGQEAQYKATVAGLTAGRETTFEITVTFSNGQSKTRRVKAIVKP